jgi:hypothetical protein
VQDDVVDTLLKLGLNREMATMSIPFVWFRVATTDPYSPVIIGIVHAIQAKLATMGIKTRGDGFVDGYTTAALNRIAGDRWKQSYWINVIDDVNFAGAHGLPAKEQAMGYLGNDDYASTYMTMEGDEWSEKHMVLGAVPQGPAFWCSDRTPQAGCKALNNICKPMDATTLAIFKGIQREANKILAKLKKGVLDVDGRIGRLTRTAINQILGSNFQHCDEVAGRSQQILASLATKAASMGAAPVPDPKGGSKPSVVVKTPEGGTTVFHPPEQAGFVGFVKSPIGMASVAGAVVLFLVMSDKKKPKKKARKPRRKRRLPKKRVTHSFY